LFARSSSSSEAAASRCDLAQRGPGVDPGRGRCQPLRPRHPGRHDVALARSPNDV